MTGARPTTSRAPSPRRRRLRPPGALTLIFACFAASALLRAADPGGTLAQAAASMGEAGDASGSEPTAAVCEPVDDPSGLLAALRERERQLDDRAAAIADRERLLDVAEAKFKEQLEALRTAEEKLAATLAVADEAAEADIEKLVSVYENMKPKDASKIFESMDVTFAAGFLARMRQEAAARILGGMSAERAYAVSAVIAGRNASVPRE